MATVTLNLTFADQSFPAGTSLGNITASLTGAQPSNTYSATGPAGSASIAIPNVNADTYAVSVQQLDGNGNALGAAVTASVVVAAANVTLSVPVSVAAAVS